MKVYNPQDQEIHIHQSRVKACPPLVFTSIEGDDVVLVVRQSGWYLFWMNICLLPHRIPSRFILMVTYVLSDTFINDSGDCTSEVSARIDSNNAGSVTAGKSLPRPVDRTECTSRREGSRKTCSTVQVSPTQPFEANSCRGGGDVTRTCYCLSQNSYYCIMNIQHNDVMWWARYRMMSFGTL